MPAINSTGQKNPKLNADDSKWGWTNTARSIDIQYHFKMRPPHAK